MLFNFTKFNESNTESDDKVYPCYCYAVYDSETPKRFTDVKKLLESIDGIQVIYNHYVKGEIYLHVVIRDKQNEYLKSYVRDILYKLDKLGVNFYMYSENEINFFMKHGK